jgi:hypothetical protein
MLVSMIREEGLVFKYLAWVQVKCTGIELKHFLKTRCADPKVTELMDWGGAFLKPQCFSHVPILFRGLLDD